MPKLSQEDKESLIKAGWAEYTTGMPADLFFSGKGAKTPWADKPHLHLNYAMDETLQSLTWKNTQGSNTYLFQNGEWLTFNGVPEELKSQAEWLKNNLK